MSNWVWPLLFVVGMGLLVGGGIAIPMWYLSSRWSGWSALERDYRATAPWKGPRWRSTSASLGSGPRLFMGIHTGTGLAPNHPLGARYGGFVAVGADDSGFHLSALIRLWHPPLLIPWDHVQMEVPAGGRESLPHQIFIGRDPVVVLTLPERLANRIAPPMLRSRGAATTAGA